MSTQIYFFPAPIDPQPAQKRKTVSRQPRNAVSHVVDCCLSLPPPHPTVLPIPPSHPAPSAGKPTYLLTQRTQLVSLTNHSTMARPCFSLFLAGGQLPLYMYQVVR